MTKSELDQIGQSLLSQYNMNSIAQQAIDAAARHGLTLTRTEIKDIPVRVTMQYADGRWDDQVDIINPLSEYSNIAFSKLYRIYKDAPYYYEDVTLFRIAFCFDDGEEEIAAIECSLLAPWRMCEVLVEKGLAQTTAEFRPDATIAGGEWYYRHSSDSYKKYTLREFMQPGMWLDPWDTNVGKILYDYDHIVLLSFDEKQMTFTFDGKTYSVRNGCSLSIRKDSARITITLNKDIPAVYLHIEKGAMRFKPFMGSSYFWDAPQLPSEDMYPWTTDENGNKYPMQFICQLNCKELPENGVLPRKGMLWFFGEVDYFLGYDVEAPCGMGLWPKESIKVLYADVDSSLLKRVNFFTEDDMIPPHEISMRSGTGKYLCFTLLGEPYEEEVSQEFGDEWTQLLQLDSDANEHYDLRFFDEGLLYLMIEKKRLLNGDFSNVQAYMTSL